MILDRIKKPNDIKNISPSEYGTLAGEIRKFIIEHVSRTGGHLASNLGVVELTMALHIALNLPEDKIIWDVGHQSYTHKILTGRKEEFDTLRQYGGLSGFPKRRESKYDAFDTGHSSTSISAGLGYVHAREIKHEHNTIAAVIGDGALTGGLALEALNNASMLKSNYIIILNDNDMSIARNVGGISTILGNIRTAEGYNKLKDDVSNVLNKIPVIGGTVVDKIRNTKSGIKQLVIPGMQYETMGITYLGPFDGHDVDKLIKAINTAKRVKHAVIIHVVTKKGKGYSYAEKNPGYYHGIAPFDIKTGKVLSPNKRDTYTDVVSNKLCELAATNKKLAAITAAMPDGTGLSEFARLYPDRFFDVGIAEEHAVTFAAGLAAGGIIPVFAVYSSFLQRAYDEILHDVCIQKLPVKFFIDRAGIVGSDGETHQGVFDYSFLNNIPNITIMAPKNNKELSDMIEFAVDYNGAVALRYPRGLVYEGLSDYNESIQYGKSECILEGSKLAIIAVGSMVEKAYNIGMQLKNQGIDITVINGRFIKPIDTECIDRLKDNHEIILTMEENVCIGGYGEQILKYISERQYNLRVVIKAIPDQFLQHGSTSVLLKDIQMDEESIINTITKEMGF